MTEFNPEQPTHQDPAEPKHLDTEVETSDQADPNGELTHGGEGVFDNGSVEVAPADPAVKTDNVLGKDYEVSTDRGYRRT